MKIEIKEIFCMEWEMGREIVLDETHAYSVSVYIGPVDSDISESFTITICNLDYIAQLLKKEDIFSGLWYLIFDNANRENIREYFQKTINGLTGKTWDEYHQKLRLIGKSEFEDYQES